MERIGAMAFVGLVAMTGCAQQSGSILGPGSTTGRALKALPSVHVGEARVLETRVSPLVPMRAELHDGAIEVRFARLGRPETRRLEPTSLEPESQRDDGPAERRGTPVMDVQRVVLDRGRFLLCWTYGSAEWGDRVMAQLFRSSNGSPLGEPVVISPPEADVIGAPHVVKVDGNRAVAVFAAASGSSFAVMAVPIDDFAPFDPKSEPGLDVANVARPMGVVWSSRGLGLP